MGGKISKSKKGGATKSSQSSFAPENRLSGNDGMKRVLSACYDMIVLKGYTAIEDEHRAKVAEAIGDVDPDDIPLDLDLLQLANLYGDDRKDALHAQLTSRGQDFSQFLEDILARMLKVDSDSAEAHENTKALTPLKRAAA